MSDNGDDDLVDDFLAAAGFGGESPLHADSAETPPAISSTKRKNVSAPSSSKAKRQRRP
jgi:hypothetical protein